MEINDWATIILILVSVFFALFCERLAIVIGFLMRWKCHGQNLDKNIWGALVGVVAFSIAVLVSIGILTLVKEWATLTTTTVLIIVMCILIGLGIWLEITDSRRTAKIEQRRS